MTKFFTNESRQLALKPSIKSDNKGNFMWTPMYIIQHLQERNNSNRTPDLH